MAGGLMRVVRIYIDSLVGEFVSLDPTSIFRSFVDEEIFESSTIRLILVDMIAFMHHGNFLMEVDLLCI